MPVISNSPLDVLRRRAWDLCVEACETTTALIPDNVWHNAVQGDFKAIKDEVSDAATNFVKAFDELQQAEKDLLKSPWE